MALLEDLANKAKTKNSRILLPESTDPRVIEASRFISDQNLAQIVLFDEDAASFSFVWFNFPSVLFFVEAIFSRFL